MSALTNSIRTVGSGLTTFAQQTIRKITGPGDIEPSDAMIDKLLPIEIMNIIFLNLDYPAVMACTAVSRCWRAHATEDQIQQHLYNSSIYDIEELRTLLLKHDPSFDLEFRVKWRQYADDYPRKWIIEDRWLATKNEKILLEVESVGMARSICYTMAPQLQYTNDVLQYWVKFRATMWYNHSMNDYGEEELYVKDSLNVPLFVDIRESTNIDKFRLYGRDGIDCEIIMKMSHVANEGVSFEQGLVKIRVLKYKKLSLNTVLLPVLKKLANK